MVPSACGQDPGCNAIYHLSPVAVGTQLSKDTVVSEEGVSQTRDILLGGGDKVPGGSIPHAGNVLVERNFCLQAELAGLRRRGLWKGTIVHESGGQFRTSPASHSWEALNNHMWPEKPIQAG